jgi:hypothetical protein
MELAKELESDPQMEEHLVTGMVLGLGLQMESQSATETELELEAHLAVELVLQRGGKWAIVTEHELGLQMAQKSVPHLATETELELDLQMESQSATEKEQELEGHLVVELVVQKERKSVQHLTELELGLQMGS